MFTYTNVQNVYAMATSTLFFLEHQNDHLMNKSANSLISKGTELVEIQSSKAVTPNRACLQCFKTFI